MNELLKAFLLNMLRNKLAGYKTYVTAVGLVGLAIYQFSQGDYEVAYTTLLASGVVTVLRAVVSSAVESIKHHINSK